MNKKLERSGDPAFGCRCERCGRVIGSIGSQFPLRGTIGWVRPGKMHLQCTGDPSSCSSLLSSGPGRLKDVDLTSFPDQVEPGRDVRRRVEELRRELNR